MPVVNPQHACAARVTVVVLCVCLSTCLSVRLYRLILALQASDWLMSNTNGSSATSAQKLMWQFRLKDAIQDRKTSIIEDHVA